MEMLGRGPKKAGAPVRVASHPYDCRRVSLEIGYEIEVGGRTRDAGSYRMSGVEVHSWKHAWEEKA